MKDPYIILGLLERKHQGDVDDAAVKKAYLELLRRYPPEREPQRFQEVRKAYELLETRVKRVQYDLFHLTIPDKEDLATALFPPRPLSRPSLQKVQDLLQQTV
jgi:curved DNA-binding protein CbpA